ncbi:hypothetical protein [Methylocucumis oryzae]|uniref:hypothetical protein n=1 Tax=Methylocucumis oryzae TaxID=1632867 RepID=UPI00103E8905|nr:hypothetical protein [Methylocucumis oryzae]
MSGRDKTYNLTKNGFSAIFNFKNVGAGANVVGFWVEVKEGADYQAEIGDNLASTPAEIAAQIDAVVTNSGTVKTPESNDVQETSSDESIIPLPQEIGAPVPDPRDQDKFYLDEDEQEVYLKQRDAKFQQFVIEKLGFEEDESTSSPGYRQALIDDDKLEFAKSAFIVNNEVIAYGGQITWGDYSASAFNGALFDSAAVEPNTLCAQIGKDGEIIARVRIELNGMVTFYRGATGIDVLATSEPSVTDIDKTVKDILGYIEPVMPHLANQLPEQSTPISPLDEFENSGGEAWQVTQAKWVEIMSGHFAFLGQEPNVSDFKEFHKSMVKQAIDAGKDIPADVLVDYPWMKMETDDEKQERLKKIEQNLSNVIDIASGKATDEEVARVMPLIKTFIGKSQLSVIKSALKGEEGQHFKDKLVEIANVIKTMPSSYETDGQGDNAVAYLHYFKGSMDWYITEKDKGAPDDKKEGVKPQSQAFGLADLGYGGELGYISIPEITSSDVELDLYWTPKTLSEISGNDSNDEQGESDMAVNDDKKSQFERELDELMTETDIQKYGQHLDDIAAQIEEAGLMDELDAKLNEAADVLTRLLSEAEKMAA